MNPTYFGAEQVTEEDRSYRGSRFSEVRDALFANPYQQRWGGVGEAALPGPLMNRLGRGIAVHVRHREHGPTDTSMTANGSRPGAGPVV